MGDMLNKTFQLFLSPRHPLWVFPRHLKNQSCKIDVPARHCRITTGIDSRVWLCTIESYSLQLRSLLWDRKWDTKLLLALLVLLVFILLLAYNITGWHGLTFSWQPPTKWLFYFKIINSPDFKKKKTLNHLVRLHNIPYMWIVSSVYSEWFER